MIAQKSQPSDTFNRAHASPTRIDKYQMYLVILWTTCPALLVIMTLTTAGENWFFNETS